MKKKLLLKVMFLLCALTIGGEVHGQDVEVKWVKVAPADLVDGDVVAIVDTTASVAMANDPKEGKAPSAKSVTLNENKDQIDTSDGELAANLQWTVAIPEAGKFQFKKDDTNFLFAKTKNEETDSLLVGVPSDDDVKVFQLVKDQANNQADFLYAHMSDKMDYYVGVYKMLFMNSWVVRSSINKDISSTVITFFKKVESNKKDLKIVFEKDNYEFDLDGGIDFISPIASTEPEERTLKYSSGNTYVAEVTADGIVTIKRRGTAVITASFEGDDDYDAASASYTLRVDKSTDDGGMNNPILASDAYDAIKNGSLASGSAYFIKGVVSKIGDDNDILGMFSSMIPGMESDGVTYYISDDGSSAEGVKQIEVTSGRGLANDELTRQRNLCVGDEVVVVGQVSYSSSTPAFSMGTGSDSESEKTPKIDKGNYMSKCISRIFGSDADIYVGNEIKVNPVFCEVNNECEWQMIPGEPTVSLSNDNLTLAAGKLIGAKEGVDTVTVSCPFKKNEADADPIFTTVKKFFVTVKSRNVEPVGKTPGYFELVTDEKVLKDNDSILIVATTDDKSYALSPTSAIMGGMSGKEVAIEDDGTIKSAPDGAAIVKLKKVGDMWALNSDEKKYFYISSNAGDGFDLSSLFNSGESAAKLRHGEIAGEIGDSAQVKIEIAADLATITMRGDSVICYAETSISTGGGGDNGGNEGSGGGSGGSGYSMNAFNCYPKDAKEGVLVKIYRFKYVPYFDVVVDKNGWLPMVSAKDVELPEGLTAYIDKEVDKDKAKVILEPVTNVKAENPYILRGTANMTYTLTAIDEAEAPEGNMLKVSKSSTGDGVYVLDTKSAEAVFYKWDDALLGSGHPYLPENVADEETKTLTMKGSGDANDDDKVDAADIVEVVNYIMETPSGNFVFGAADVNLDGQVDKDDIQEIVDIILDE